MFLSRRVFTGCVGFSERYTNYYSFESNEFSLQNTQHEMPINTSSALDLGAHFNVRICSLQGTSKHYICARSWCPRQIPCFAESIAWSWTVFGLCVSFHFLLLARQMLHLLQTEATPKTEHSGEYYLENAHKKYQLYVNYPNSQKISSWTIAILVY